jgi:hypothetical protein
MLSKITVGPDYYLTVIIAIEIQLKHYELNDSA